MIYLNLLEKQVHKDYILIVQMWSGGGRRDMILTILKHISLQWAVELPMAGILMDLAS